MAKIVLGVGTSHSPMLSTQPEHWADHSTRDHAYPLFNSDGTKLEFAELAKENDGKLRPRITVEAMRDNFARTEAALAKIRLALKEAAPDVCVIIGDDQDEMYHHDSMPSFAIYYGDEIVCKKPDMSKKAPALHLSAWGYYTDEPTTYPGHQKLALHLIDHLIGAGFDVVASASQPGGTGMSHAYTFLYQRLLDSTVPIVPVFINTYYPPNQPRAARVIEFGDALRAALARFPDNTRVAVIASGGLSHFLVDEALDLSVLDALSAGQLSFLATMSEGALKSGNSEIKNWAATGSIMAPSKMQLIDYIPAYRSEAGTGCGLAFGIWQPAGTL
jgi:3-O-methylgallate 3,4-dioxygenase